MSKFKLASMMRYLTTSGCLGLSMLFCSVMLNDAQAYETSTIFQSEHYAINQVILDKHEEFGGPIQSSITGDIQTFNRLKNLYQSTTVIFPSGSVGFTGKLNTPALGVLTISNYGSGKDRIYMNRNAKYTTFGGIYISYKQLIEMINHRVLNSLIKEFKKLPIIISDVPVSATGFDPTTSSFFVTSASDAVILDVRIDDSVFYPKEEYQKLHQNCKVDLMFFIDRIVTNIPLFMGGRAAINSIKCGAAPAKAYAGKDNTAPAIVHSFDSTPAARSPLAN